MIFAPLITMSLGMIAKELAFVCAKKLARNAAQHPVIQRHILKKVEKKLGMKLMEEPATEQNLERLRQVFREELGPYMDLEDVMDNFQNTLEELARQQHAILEGLDDIKSLLEKISYPASHFITIENPFLREEMPTDLLERVISGYLVGKKEATAEFDSLVDSGKIPLKIKRQLDEFKFLQMLREQEREKLRNFVKKLKELPGSYHDLRVYMEIRQLLEIALTRDEKKIIVGWILDQISQSRSKKDVAVIISFSQLLIRLGADEYIPQDISQEIINNFRDILTSSTRNDFTPTEQLEMLHFIHVFDRLTRKEIELLDRLVTEQQKETFGEKFKSKHPQRTKISNPIARMIRKLKIWKIKPERSVRILESELRKLRERKFKRDTLRLKKQLERITTETNLLASFLESDWHDADRNLGSVKLDDLEYIMKELIAILNNRNLKNLSDETVLLVLEALDACLYLMDLIALKNSRAVLLNAREISQALWIKELEKYRKTSKRTLKDILTDIKNDPSYVDETQLDEFLPPPPEDQKDKEKGGPQAA